MPMPPARGRRWPALLALVALLVPAGLAAMDTAEPCRLDGKAEGPCKITGVSLADHALTQALPFDVPVFLEGQLPETDKTTKGLTLHVFTARKPFRVEQACAETGKSWDECEKNEWVYRCVGNGSERSLSGRSEYLVGELDGVSPGAGSSCALIPQAGGWRRAVDERDWVVAVPPLPANRQVVLLLEVEKPPSDDVLAEIEWQFEQKVSRALDVAALTSAPTAEQWLTGLQKELCSIVDEVGKENGIRLVGRGTPLLDCAGLPGAADWELLGDAYSALVNIEVQRDEIRKLEESSQIPSVASAAVDQLLSLQSLPEDGLEETRKNLEATIAAPATTPEEREKAENLVAAIEQIESSADFLQAKITSPDLALSIVRLQGTTIGSFLTRQKSYLAADFGVLYADDPDQAVPYLGTNIYFRPVNKQAPLPGPHLFWRQPLRRLSLTVGLTLYDFDAERAEPLFASNNLVAGLGYRLTDSIRLSGGAVVFREKDPDLLQDKKETAYSPYVAISFDADVSGLVNWFQKLWGSGS